MCAQNDREYAVFNLNRDSRIAARVRVAATSSARRKGLLGANALDGESGLWIAPCEAIHTFGMKMPIDAIFLDRSLRVKKLLRELPPRRLSVCISASSVLEVGAGTISRTATELGDRLTFQAASPAQLPGVETDNASKICQPFSRSF